MTDSTPSGAAPQTHRVVVVGGGFGGLRAVHGLRRAPVQVTLIDRRNFHLFQPLTYQVATGALSPAQVAYPLRALFKSAANVGVVLADVTGFDLERREVTLAENPEVATARAVAYDTLVVAAGSSYSYFGHDDWSEYAHEVKTLESALSVRSRILQAFENAELSSEPEERDAELTFVVVGGGPTGVEMAGQIAELAGDTLARDFRRIDSRTARVLLMDTEDRILQGFPKSLSAKAARSLARLGVTPMTGQTVVDVNAESVVIRDGDGNRRRIATRTVIWAAGVTGSSLAQRLAELSGADIDRTGRIGVERDLTLPGHPDVIVLGDMVRVSDGHGGWQELPGVAPVAIQQGTYAARLIRDRLEGRRPSSFRYRNKGNVATIGRARAVVDLHLIRLSGLPAWLVWLVVHLWYLIGFQNRLLVTIQWWFSFLSHGRSARLINDPAATGPDGADRSRAAVG